MYATRLIASACAVLLCITAATEEGYQSLLADKELSQWTTKGNWSVDDDGVLTIVPRDGEEGWQRYDAYLWSKVRYADFELDLEFMIPKDGNSGVFFRVGDPADPVEQGIEVQINDTHGKKNVGPHDCGGVISTAAPSENAAKPHGEWNQLTIRCVGNSLKVRMNGKDIIDIEMDKTVLKNRPADGYIGLQDHGLVCSFRNVRIKDLSAE